MIVYLITNKINGKRYVGQTVQPADRRFKRHISDAISKKHNYPLHEAVRKYGKGNFEIRVLSRCDSLEEMNHRESYYIKLFKSLAHNGYNVSLGGQNGPMIGRKHKESTKVLQAIGSAGRIKSKEERQKLSLANSGKKLSKERVEKSVTNWGKNSDKEKVRKENADRAKRMQSKPVLCIENNTIYYSVREAARQLNVFSQNIRRVLQGKASKTGGYTFRRVS
jgi:group I intron endonuclease